MHRPHGRDPVGTPVEVAPGFACPSAEVRRGMPTPEIDDVIGGLEGPPVVDNRQTGQCGALDPKHLIEHAVVRATRPRR
jgi:hypothetical protein